MHKGNDASIDRLVGLHHRNQGLDWVGPLCWCGRRWLGAVCVWAVSNPAACLSTQVSGLGQGSLQAYPARAASRVDRPHIDTAGTSDSLRSGSGRDVPEGDVKAEINNSSPQQVRKAAHGARGALSVCLSLSLSSPAVEIPS
jgi:hypothetical protein